MNEEALPPAAAPVPEEERPLTLIERIVDGGLNRLAFWRQLAYLFYEFWIGLFGLRGNRRNYVKNLTIHQIIFSGIDAIGVVSAVAVVIGGVVLVQMMAYSPGFQSNSFLMTIIISLIVKEIAPLFTALVLVGRSGSAITVELGNMRVKGHHEALAAMDIDIVQYFHVPRVIGLTLAGMLLNGYFVLMTFLSWALISTFQRGVDLAKTAHLFIDSLSAGDFVISAVKGGLIGMSIAFVCIHEGTNVRRSVTEIPQRASRAIVTSFLAAFIINMLVSVVWYLLL